MTTLTITEHPGGYADRTRHNARYADLTVAFAINFDTPGERLTHSAAGHKYLAIPWCDYWLKSDAFTPAEMILAAMARWRAEIVNIAGNGIYTLSRQGVHQEYVDDFLFDILAIVHGQHEIKEIVTGGQTGMDIGGAVAAMAVGVEKVSVVMPKGFMQRLADGRDIVQSEQSVRDKIEYGVERLLGCNVTR